MEADVEEDLRTLARFIDVYCRRRHPASHKSPASLKTHDVQAVVGATVRLCSDCQKLLAHAFVKRSRCPLEPKPACKHCQSHCYHPDYRRRIQRVMKYSGLRLLFSGRLGYLIHLLF